MSASETATAPRHSPTRRERVLAQVAVLLGLACAVAAFFWDSGLPPFLLAVVGVAVTVLGAWLTPDGWLVDPEDAA